MFHFFLFFLLSGVKSDIAFLEDLVHFYFVEESCFPDGRQVATIFSDLNIDVPVAYVERDIALSGRIEYFLYETIMDSVMAYTDTYTLLEECTLIKVKDYWGNILVQVKKVDSSVHSIDSLRKKQNVYDINEKKLAFLVENVREKTELVLLESTDLEKFAIMEKLSDNDSFIPSICTVQPWTYWNVTMLNPISANVLSKPEIIAMLLAIKS